MWDLGFRVQGCSGDSMISRGWLRSADQRIPCKEIMSSIEKIEYSKEILRGQALLRVDSWLGGMGPRRLISVGNVIQDN